MILASKKLFDAADENSTSLWERTMVVPVKYCCSLYCTFTQSETVLEKDKKQAMEKE